jgi:hypothetical protein
MAGLKAVAAPKPGPRCAQRSGVAKGRNEEEDGEAVAAAAGSARTPLGTDHGRCIRTAERRRQAPPSRSERIGGQWTE